MKNLKDDIIITGVDLKDYLKAIRHPKIRNEFARKSKSSQVHFIFEFSIFKFSAITTNKTYSKLMNHSGVIPGEITVGKFADLCEKLIEITPDPDNVAMLVIEEEEDSSPCIEPSDMQEFMLNHIKAGSHRHRRIVDFLSTVDPALHYDPKDDVHGLYKDQSLIKFQPCARTALVVPIKTTKVSQGGIILQEKDQESIVDKEMNTTNYVGMIVSASPDTQHYKDPTTGNYVPYKAGDICVYAKHRETYVSIGNQSYLMVMDMDIWGIIPENTYYDFNFSARADRYANLRYRLKKNNVFDDKPKKIK